MFERIKEALYSAPHLLKSYIEPLHAADIADVIENLTPEERITFLEYLKGDLDPEVISYLDLSIRDELIKFFDTPEIAAVVRELETDDAIDIIEELSEEDQEKVLKALPHEERKLLEEGLSYNEESAGRLMQRDIVAIPTFWTVGETIDHMRNETELPDDFYDVIVVDPKFHPVGMVPLSRILRARREVVIESLMSDIHKLIPVDMDQEEIAHLFRKYGLVSAPVVNKEGRLLGAMTVDDVVEVVNEEAEEDLMKLSGLAETNINARPVATAKARITWLLINLFTALIASVVVSLFDQTIVKFVALAVLLPIVPSLGGNAGTQTLAVTVRALATHALTKNNANRVVTKEVKVALLNGLGLALLTGMIAGFWFQNIWLGFVIACAVIVNFIVSALAGTLIPMGFQKLKIDPAVSSGVFLTALTDSIGIFAFLGLAALLLV